jgi:cytidylate kinase
LLRIAIDGPAGSGKSTISKILAQKLNLLYVDTGAMYRACAYVALKYNLANDKLVEKIQNAEIILKNESNQTKVFIKIDNNMEKITEKIRSVEISNYVSKIAKIKELRDILSEKQKKIASNNNIIMDGRDIGTVIIPDAEFKFFLTASPEIRALRRFNELKSKDNVTYTEILEEIKRRDFEDMNRAVSPLIKADDAIEINTSDMSINDVVNKILTIVRYS